MNSTTWAEAIDYAWPEIELSIGEVSRPSYRIQLRKYERAWGSLSLTSLSARDVSLYFGQRQQQVKAASVRHEYAVLRRVIGICIRDRMLDSDPTSLVRIPGGVYNTTDWITPAEEFQLEENLCPAWGSLVRFATNTGLRRLEMMRLLRSDIDPEGGTVTVRIGKTKRTRVVPLNRVALEMASAWMRSHDLPMLFMPQAKDRLKCGKAFSAALKRAVQKIGMRRVHARTLRHTFASRLVQKGVSLFVVQQLLGHTDPKMTMRYAHLGPGPLRDAVMLL